MHTFSGKFGFKVPWVTEVVVFSARGGIFRGRPKAKATNGAWVTKKTLLKTEAAHETVADPDLQIFWSKHRGEGPPPPPPGPSPGSTTVKSLLHSGDLRGWSRGRVQGVPTLPPLPEMTCGFLIQLYSAKKKTMWFIGFEVEQETSAPPP